MTVTRLPSGNWAVLDNTGTVISEHETNSAAWRAHDRLNSEPVSKRESTVDWLWLQGLDR